MMHERIVILNIFIHLSSCIAIVDLGQILKVFFFFWFFKVVFLFVALAVCPATLSVPQAGLEFREICLRLHLQLWD